MKKIITAIFVFIFFAHSPVWADSQYRECPATRGAEDAVKAETSMANDIFNTYIQEPDFSALDSCLDGIGNFTAGISISLPSLDSILEGLCNLAKEAISDAIGEATSSINAKYSFSGLGSISGSAGSNAQSGVHYQVNDRSQTVLNSIWDNIQ